MWIKLRPLRAAGLEPARPYGQGVLSALCLPIPSRPLDGKPSTNGGSAQGRTPLASGNLRRTREPVCV